MLLRGRVTSRLSAAHKVAEGSHQNTIGQEDVSTGVSGAEGGGGWHWRGLTITPKPTLAVPAVLCHCGFQPKLRDLGSFPGRTPPPTRAAHPDQCPWRRPWAESGQIYF